VTAEHAEQLLTELRGFADGLTSPERALLGALVAPAFAQALGHVGATTLPPLLAEALRTHPEAMAALGVDALDR